MKILVEKDTKLAKFCLYDDQKVTLNKKTDMHGITVLILGLIYVILFIFDTILLRGIVEILVGIVIVILVSF